MIFKDRSYLFIPVLWGNKKNAVVGLLGCDFRILNMYNM